MSITVLKLGGELLEDAAAIRQAAESIVTLCAAGPVAVVHGGGRAIDAELRARGVEPRFVDGLRVTDTATLDVVVSVLAGRANTSLVAAIAAAGGRAVGLTGADASIGVCDRAQPITSVSGAIVDLGLVGTPVGCEAALLHDLVERGYIPVLCSIGIDRQGSLLNVNADTLAAHLAAWLHAKSLIIAGTTPGVLGADGEPIAELGVEDIDIMTASGAAHSGMIAKLAACREAALGGVEHVTIVNGRIAEDLISARGTRIIARTPVRESSGAASAMASTAGWNA